MSRPRVNCSECGRKMVQGRCVHIECPGSKVQAPQRSWPTTAEVGEALRRNGRAYLDVVVKTLVFPGALADSTFPLEGCGSERMHRLLLIVRRHTGLSDARCKRDTIERLLQSLMEELTSATSLPVVRRTANCPQVFEKDGRLLYPFSATEVIYDGVRYVGDVLQPCSTGMFEAFLLRTRCADEANRRTLREWLLSQLLRPLYGPGGSPALLLCAAVAGAGKTSTATAIGDLLGGHVMVTWASGVGLSAIYRMLQGRDAPVLVIDNLAPSATATVANYPDLASLITTSSVHVSALYRQGREARQNDVSYILTANTPVLTPELQDRTCVVTLDPKQGDRQPWHNFVAEHRTAILEDMLYTILEAQRPPAVMPADRRWMAWASAVSRITGEVPQLQQGLCALISVLAYAVDLHWVSDEKRCELQHLVYRLTNLRARAKLAHIVGQRRINSESIREAVMSGELAGFGIVEEGNAVWLVRKEQRV